MRRLADVPNDTLHNRHLGGFENPGDFLFGNLTYTIQTCISTALD